MNVQIASAATAVLEQGIDQIIQGIKPGVLPFSSHSHAYCNCYVKAEMSEIASRLAMLSHAAVNHTNCLVVPLPECSFVLIMQLCLWPKLSTDCMPSLQPVKAARLAAARSKQHRLQAHQCTTHGTQAITWAAEGVSAHQHPPSPAPDLARARSRLLAPASTHPSLYEACTAHGHCLCSAHRLPMGAVMSALGLRQTWTQV